MHLSPFLPTSSFFLSTHAPPNHARQVWPTRIPPFFLFPPARKPSHSYKPSCNLRPLFTAIPTPFPPASHPQPQLPKKSSSPHPEQPDSDSDSGSAAQPSHSHSRSLPQCPPQYPHSCSKSPSTLYNPPNSRLHLNSSSLTPQHSCSQHLSWYTSARTRRRRCFLSRFQDRWLWIRKSSLR